MIQRKDVSLHKAFQIASEWQWIEVNIRESKRLVFQADRLLSKIKKTTKQCSKSEKRKKKKIQMFLLQLKV